MRRVTREQKLALIVGFSLVLLVGVLISDHLSSAKKAKIAKVEPENKSTQPAPITLADRRMDPAPISFMGGADPSSNPPSQQPASSPGAAPVNPMPPVAEPREQVVAQPQPAAPHPVEPTRVAQNTPSNEAERALAEELRRLGGNITPGNDGVGIITLPAPTRTVATKPTKPELATSPIPSRVGPIEVVKMHTVGAGENLYQIAAKYYQNGNLWKDLAKFNAMDRGGSIRVGMKLKIPSKETLTGTTMVAHPESAMPMTKKPAVREAVTPPAPTKPAPMKSNKPGRIELASYTVRKGDTLGDISRKTLGTSKRWQEIVDLNNLDDEDNIPIGTVLRIPAKRG